MCERPPASDVSAWSTSSICGFSTTRHRARAHHRRRRLRGAGCVAIYRRIQPSLVPRKGRILRTYRFPEHCRSSPGESPDPEQQPSPKLFSSWRSRPGCLHPGSGDRQTVSRRHIIRRGESSWDALGDRTTGDDMSEARRLRYVNQYAASVEALTFDQRWARSQGKMVARHDTRVGRSMQLFPRRAVVRSRLALGVIAFESSDRGREVAR